MDIGWNFRREHLRPLQRSHSVVTDGGDQPNVVPPRASVWYFFREMDYPRIRENFEKGLKTARGAALMTDTEVEHRILGAAWPRHFNRPIAEAMDAHIRAVGLPEWSEEDQALARAVQRVVDADSIPGLATELDTLRGPPEEPESGGSDDIGDISWTAPTVTLRFPSNIPELPGHHWSEAIAMATPIAHKGATAGAKVLARTALELYAKPALLEEARAYFEEQTAAQEYEPLIGDAPPPTHLNREIMEEYRPRLEPFYYDESRYDTYLEQLGIEYPSLDPPAEGGAPDR
jgi:aminobenzoyl-glutamate utilization protein B